MATKQKARKALPDDAMRLRRGYGQGRGAKYKPWYQFEETYHQRPRPHALLAPGWKSGRAYHLIGDLAIDYFFHLEWAKGVTEIRESFPLLPLEETLAIAQETGMHHPRGRYNRPIIMTSSFLLTVTTEHGTEEWVSALCWSDELESEHLVQHLEIQRRYWEQRGADWKIVTEKEMSSALASNVALIHAYCDSHSLYPLSKEEIGQIAAVLTRQVQQNERPLNKITLACDESLGLEIGTSMSLARHLIASRQWIVDMEQPITPHKQLILLGVHLS